VTHGHEVCPVERAGKLESWWRKILQNPEKILGKHVKKGMRCLDFGCGPGYFTITMARLAGPSGKVFAVDLQGEMLGILKRKMAGTPEEKNIELHKSEKGSLSIGEKIDFALAFYVVHEVPDTKNFFSEIRGMLKQGGCLLISEPMFRVSKEEFEEEIRVAESLGFKVTERPKIFMGRSALFCKPF